MRDAPCWSARCFSNTPPLLSISLKSYPNDDPRLTFNHYLHCPFKNYSTPLHSFNSRSMRWIPVIVHSLIDAIFWGHVISFFFLSPDMMHSKELREDFDFLSKYYLCCIMQGKPTSMHLLPSLTEAKLRLLIQPFI